MRANITYKDDGESITIRMHLRTNAWGGGTPFLSFDFPFMHPPSLDKFIAGEDCEEQDDNGFRISLKDHQFTISMGRDDECANETVLILHENDIRDALLAIKPIYAKIVERIGYDVTLGAQGGLAFEAEQPEEDVDCELCIEEVQAVKEEKTEPLQKQVTITVGDYTYKWNNGKVSFTSTSEVYRWKNGEVTFHPQ